MIRRCLKENEPDNSNMPKLARKSYENPDHRVHIEQHPKIYSSYPGVDKHPFDSEPSIMSEASTKDVGVTIAVDIVVAMTPGAPLLLGLPVLHNVQNRMPMTGALANVCHDLLSHLPFWYHFPST
jgi:hypothetical protein